MGLALGMAGIALVALLPVAVIWALLHLERVGELIVAALRRCRLLPPEPQEITQPPVERLAADLRRLSAAALEVPRGTSHARRKGLLIAYDDTLVAACRALDVPQSLTALPAGLDRDLERLRVEAALESAGLRFRTPGKRQDAP
jgi:hypothetical protein